MTEIFEMPQMKATPLIPNSEDWLKALKAINPHQERLSRNTINECITRHGHRKCCCICGDVASELTVASQLESPLFALVCIDCFNIQLIEHHVPFYHTRPLSQEENDILLCEAGRLLQA